jgi:hypothetical protein
MGNESLIYKLGRIGRLSKFISKKHPYSVMELIKRIVFKFLVIERFLPPVHDYQPAMVTAVKSRFGELRGSDS